jgi:hypothetical protein
MAWEHHGMSAVEINDDFILPGVRPLISLVVPSAAEIGAAASRPIGDRGREVADYAPLIRPTIYGLRPTGTLLLRRQLCDFARVFDEPPRDRAERAVLQGNDSNGHWS